MGKAKKTPKFAVMKKTVTRKAIKSYKEEVLNPNRKDLTKDNLPRNVPQVSSALYFKHNTALGPPYLVLVDTNFINFSIQNKLDLEKAMMDCLYAKCTPCITDCVMAELEKLGLSCFEACASAARTLSWHLASATKSTMKGFSCCILSSDEAKLYGKTSPAFNNSLDGQKSKRMRSASATRAAMQTLGVSRRDYHSECSKPLTQHRSFDNPVRSQKEIVHPPHRSKSMLSAFFAKQNTPNVRTNA